MYGSSAFGGFSTGRQERPHGLVTNETGIEPLVNEREPENFSALPISLFAARFRRTGSDGEFADRILECWDSLSDQERGKFVKEARALKPQQPCGASVQTLTSLCRDSMALVAIEYQMEEEEEEAVDVPEEAQRFVSEFRDLLMDVNPQLRASQVDRALVEMAAQEAKWMEMIEEFPQAQIARHRAMKQGRLP